MRNTLAGQKSGGIEVPSLESLLFAVFFASLIASFVFYESLVQREYSVARDQWEADGRPPGFFWAGEGTSIWNARERDRALYRLLCSTPEWIASDQAAQSAHRNMRRAWLVGLAVWLVGFWLMFFS